MSLAARRIENTNAAAGASAGVAGTLDEALFDDFRALILETTGIQLAESKKAMLITRLSKRLNALGMSSYADYLALVKQPGHAERTAFIDAVTTNLTYFFREPHHFAAVQRLLSEPEAIAKPGPVRIWSAGCSSGQEPYSLAISVAESGILKHRQVRILCTDIHSGMPRLTSHGSFDESGMRGLSDERRDRWFKRGIDGRWVADQALRSLLICKQLNLFDSWPIKPGVDMIFCRNTLIYFDDDRTQQVLRGFASRQNPGAHLFIGHSERIDGVNDLYFRFDNTVFERR